jgi:hypothetical protein
VYTFFAPYSSSYLLSQSTPPPTGASPSPWAGLVPPYCSLILEEKREKKKGNHDILALV